MTSISPKHKQDPDQLMTPSKRKPGRPLKQSSLLHKMVANLNDLSTNAENNI